VTVGGNNGREGTEREVEWLTATAPSIHHRGSEEDGLWVREGQGGGGVGGCWVGKGDVAWLVDHRGAAIRPEATQSRGGAQSVRQCGMKNSIEGSPGAGDIRWGMDAGLAGNGQHGKTRTPACPRTGRCRCRTCRPDGARPAQQRPHETGTRSPGRQGPGSVQRAGGCAWVETTTREGCVYSGKAEAVAVVAARVCEVRGPTPIHQ
jgi:hypothetical protein